MDFTELFKQSSGQVFPSPSHEHIATIFQNKVVVRDAESLEPVRSFTGTDMLSDLEWSPDGNYVLVCGYKTDTVYVWCVWKKEWNARIDETIVGLAGARWGPDSRHVLTYSSFDLRLTIWPLTGEEPKYIQNPKKLDKGIAFRKGSKFIAVVERKDFKDYIGVYDAMEWNLLKSFHVETLDLAGIVWSPNGHYIVAWESMLEYKLHVFTPDGHKLTTYSAYDTGLGIKSICWSPNSDLLAVGSYDQKVRLFSHYTWSPLYTFSHPERVTPAPHLTIYREVEVPIPENETDGPPAKYEIIPSSMQIQVTRTDPDKPNPRLGCGLCEFDSAGRFLVTRNDNMPQCLWVWEVERLRLRVLAQQSAAIRVARWSPTRGGLLAFVCGGNNVYLWTEKSGCECVEVPMGSFRAVNLRWSLDGKSIILLDKESFCVAFLLDE